MYSHAWKYCPWCGQTLVERNIYGSDRMACPDCDFIYFPRPNLVVLVVVEYAGKILLGRRKMEPGRGKWTFLGGFVNRDERVQEAAVREIKEETSLAIQLEGLVGLYEEFIAGLVLAVYSATVTAENPQLTRQVEEVSELAFFSPEELPEMAFPGDPQIIEDWKRFRLQNAVLANQL
jgi:ADP-ribose pyrophosphatase YjhB (NUDIX family)